ncbi:phospholipid carrier-dependent glycosyltransferase [Candidatus Dojkabacteria bacterium]|nr:phospholipid carrier-dependent glycosyltransferase [Candidatus Dojkabacteria bacterium]
MINKWVLPVILVIAFLLRVVGLNQYPIGFTPDEASFGYDTYSILKTGKDQWGNFMPLVLKSFGDYKAPLYTYLTIPFVAVFDLTKFAVRLPNALLGVGAVYVLYLLVCELLKNVSNLALNSRLTALLASLLLAVSPWHIMMSRGAFEANLITFFLPLGIYLFLKNQYLLSSFVFGLNLFTYHSAKLITPLIVFALVVYSFNNLKKVGIKKLIPSVVVLSIFGLLTLYTFTQGAGARVKDVNIFSGSTEEGSVNKNLAVTSGEPYLKAKLFNNKFTVSADRFINNFVSYFSPQFLLTRGPAETTYGMMPGNGVLNIVEFIGLVVFIVYMLRFENKKLAIFLIFWLFVSAVPASLATGPGFAGNRAVAMVPAVQIIASIGLTYLILKRKYLKYGILTLGIISFIIFSEKYLFLSPHKSASGMLYGNLEVAEYLNSFQNNYETVIVSKSISEPHIYVAFATKFEPKEYQEATKSWQFEENNLKWVDQLPEYKMGKYVFRKYNWRDGLLQNNLVVARPEEFLPDTETIFKVNYPNGEPSIYVKSN